MNAAGHSSFNHVAANGEFTGRREQYTTAQVRDHGFQVVLLGVPRPAYRT